LNPTPTRRFRSTNSFNSLRRKELARHSRTNSSADNREAPRNSRNGFFSLMLGEALELRKQDRGETVAAGPINLIMDFRFSLKISSLPVY
ncbi:hypothetical protein MKW92_020594, partial [Papaver armeniacum]